MNKFTERLKAIRQEKGISQKDLANKIGCTPQAFNRWEKNKTSPDFDTLMSIAKELGVSIDYLLGASDNKNADSVLTKFNSLDDKDKKLVEGIIDSILNK